MGKKALDGRGILLALRNRNVSFYLLGRFPGTIAVQMMSVAVGWP